LPIPKTACFKGCVCGRSLAGIVDSNPAGSWIYVSFECCVLSGKGLDQTYHSSRRILSNVMCLSMNVKRQKWEVPDQLGAMVLWKENPRLKTVYVASNKNVRNIWIFVKNLPLLTLISCTEKILWTSSFFHRSIALTSSLPGPPLFRGFTIKLSYTLHTRQDSSGRVISRNKDLYLTTHNTQNRLPFPRRDSNTQSQQRAVADTRFKLLGHWDYGLLTWVTTGPSSRTV
jgi:hypothetical protein